MSDISIDNLENGQEIEVPYEVTGSATITTGNAAIVAWQIDDKPIHNIPSLGGASPTFTFEFTIGEQDCPQVNTWYMLSVYLWEVGTGGSGDCTIESVTFKRIGPTPIPDGGGSHG